MPALIAGILTIAAAVAADLPDVEAAIPAPVKALGQPAMLEFPGGIRMAVSAATEEAQAHVLQGLNHLHGGWEFEASRHFAAAMREDPECLLAHWGMIMCLLNPTPETSEARIAASERMLELIEQGKGTELERGYAYGLVKYIEEGPAGAANAFHKVATRFPNDLQAAIFAALFKRGGFDEAGDATPDQERAEKDLLALVEKFPQSPVPLNALLFIRAEARDLTDSLELAQRLTRLVPDYPPFTHLLGHYQWRCGQHAMAASSFGKAASQYQEWMKQQNVSVADCPEWAKAECYRVVALASKGDFKTALAAAREVAATPLSAERPASPGSRFLLWEAKTLPARLLLHGDARGSTKDATASLPKPADLKKLHEHSLAYWWIDGLRFALEARRLLEKNDLLGAREVLEALGRHSDSMSKMRTFATASGEISFFSRAFRSLEVLASELRGQVAMAGPAAGRETAYNWFSAAADRQHPATLLLPPSILTPMATRLGEFHLKAKRPAEAVEAYQRALAAFPNDTGVLSGLKTALEAAGKTTEAAETAAKIEALKNENPER
ncbi:MAG: tetratricopeptide repeat protein [Verrucomicrobiaceae bacterium]|nr:MAG: tetratricopeptide repeat protein [Verrucomicrobiaceae bacterium]